MSLIDWNRGSPLPCVLSLHAVKTGEQQQQPGDVLGSTFMSCYSKTPLSRGSDPFLRCWKIPLAATSGPFFPLLFFTKQSLLQHRQAEGRPVIHTIHLWFTRSAFRLGTHTHTHPQVECPAPHFKRHFVTLLVKSSVLM